MRTINELHKIVHNYTWDVAQLLDSTIVKFYLFDPNFSALQRESNYTIVKTQNRPSRN